MYFKRKQIFKRQQCLAIASIHGLFSSLGTSFCSMEAPWGKICRLIVGLNNIDDHPSFFNCVDYFKGHDVGSDGAPAP